MYVYFDQNGTLKEIITEKTFRVGDSKRDKIYVYWDGEHSPISGWIKYRKPDGTEYPISVEECFYQIGENQLVGKELPSKPLRNLKYFSYDHTYEENGETKIGYKFYEIVVPDAVLNVSNDDEKEPTKNNMIVARIRFVMDDGAIEGEVDEADSIEALGAVVFAVETNIGILTDSSINESQYNYLISLISIKLGLNVSSQKVQELPESGVAGTIYYVEKEDGDSIVYDAYMWNGSQFVFMGTTSYDLYTKQEGEDFETAIQALWNAELSAYKDLMNSEFLTLQKATSQQVESLQNLIQSAASGSPKGVYQNVTALENAYPTGTSGIYVVLSNGYWYYWNTTNAAWTVGGQYLSITGMDENLDETSTNPVQNKAIIKQGFDAIFNTKINVLNNSHWFSFYSIVNDLVPYRRVSVQLPSVEANTPYTFFCRKSNSRAEQYYVVIYCYNSSNEGISQLAQPREKIGTPFVFVFPEGTHHAVLSLNVNNGTPSGVKGETIYWDNCYLIKGYNPFVSFDGSYLEDNTVGANALSIVLKSTNLYIAGDKYLATTGNTYQASNERINDIVPGKRYYLNIGETNSHASTTIGVLYAYDSEGNLLNGYNLDYGTTTGLFMEWIAPANISYIKLSVFVSNSIAVGQVGEIIYFKDIYFGEDDYMYALKSNIKVENQSDDFNFLLIKNTETYIPVGGSHAGTEITFAAGYIDTSGVFQASASYSCTDYIELKLNPIIDSHIYGLTTFLSYSFYDEDKTLISGIHADSDWGTISGIQTTPATAKYVRICLMKADASGFVNFSDMERISTVEDAVLKLQVETKIDNVEKMLVSSEKVMVSDISGEGVQNGFIDDTGTFQSTASWVVTGYIPCKYLSEITEHVHGYSTCPYAVYYDKYKVFIGSQTLGSEGVEDVTLSIPTDAFYVRLNMLKLDPIQYYVCVTNEKEKSAFNTINKFDLLYGKKLGAAGDSITIGTYSVPGMTYINQIANAHSMTVDNQGIWGSVFPTGKTEGGNPRGSIYSQIANLSNDCDAVILSGGINDAEYWDDDEYWGTISGGYNATLDTTTFCGAFEAMLRDALAKWKGKPILFVFEHRMTTTYQSAYGQHFENVQIPLMIEMLEKWGVPYVDLFHDMPSLKLTSGYIELYSFDNQGVHPNVAGYRKFYVPRVESKLISLLV